MDYEKLLEKYEGRIRLCFDIIEQLILESEVYVYGKYAQYGLISPEWKNETSSYYSIIGGYAIGQILKHSIVGILVLVEGYQSPKKMQDLAYRIEDLIYSISEDSFLRDIRVLDKKFYKSCLEKSSDMRKLDKYKKDLRKIEWIDK